MLFSSIEGAVSSLEKPVIIGINGVITSGKTTLSEGLAKYLQGKGFHTQIIHADDFHHPRAMRMKDNTVSCYFENAMKGYCFIARLLMIFLTTKSI